MSQLAAAPPAPRARLAKAGGLAFAAAVAPSFLSSSIRSSAPSLTLQQAAKVGERHEVFHENGFSSDEGDLESSRRQALLLLLLLLSC